MPRKKKAAQPADSQESRTVTIYAEILQPTDSAVLIRCGESELWLPLSQIPDFNAERGDTNVEIAIPEWLAKKRDCPKVMALLSNRPPCATAPPVEIFLSNGRPRWIKAS